MMTLPPTERPAGPLIRTTAFVVAVVCAFPPLAAQAEILGKVRVIDGDSLEVGGRPVALDGIDAPEEEQTCTADGKPWSCGREAAFALAFETAEHWLRCDETGQNQAGEIVAVCHVGPYDLGALMVRKGWAFAYPRQSGRYAAEENEARAARAGIWRGAFETPWEWRARHRAPKSPLR